MKKILINSFTGYFEVYYGILLSWSQRRKIVKKLNETEMSYYLYAPKSDIFHRQKWRENYPNKWLESFKNFANYSKKKNITIIAGISPGLDISFKKNKFKEEIEFLKIKSECLLKNGADEIAILFDDVPKNTSLQKNIISDGDYHALFINELGKVLNKNLFVVPKIYAFELNDTDPLYINRFCENIKKNHKIFFCGRNIIARGAEDLSYVPNMKNKIIVWDNIYANDYCPKKLLISPWRHRKNVTDIMINPTGLIETDLLVLDLMSLILNKVDEELSWLKVLKKYKIPPEINFLKKYLNPYQLYDENFNLKKENIKKIIFSIDKLLWEWHSPLSREWYPYLYNLKQDFLISFESPDKDVVFKTQTIPFSNYILKSL